MHGRSSTVPAFGAGGESPSRPTTTPATSTLAIEDSKGEGSAADETKHDAGGGVPGCLVATVAEKPTPVDKLAELRQKIKDDLHAAKAKKAPKANVVVAKT